MSFCLRGLKTQLLFRKSIQSGKDGFDELSCYFSYSQLYSLKCGYSFDWNLNGFGQTVFSAAEVDTKYANILLPCGIWKETKLFCSQ